MREGSEKRIVRVPLPKKVVFATAGPELIPKEYTLNPASHIADALKMNHPSGKGAIENDTAPSPADELSVTVPVCKSKTAFPRSNPLPTCT